MGYYEAAQRISLEAGADLSEKLYRFMVVGTDGRAEVAGANARAIGASMDNPAAEGRELTIGVGGVVMVKVGSGGVTAGDVGQSAADGLLITQSSTNPRLGTVMKTGAEGDVVPFLFQPMG